MRVVAGIAACVAGVLSFTPLAAQAEIVDSVRLGEKAFLLSDLDRLYIYDSVTGNHTSVIIEETVGNPRTPVAIAADEAGENLYIAYREAVEKRDINGEIVTVAGDPVTRNFTNISDVAVFDNKVYVAAFNGIELRELEPLDLSDGTMNGSGLVNFPQSTPFRKLLITDNSGTAEFYSPGQTSLLKMPFPPVLSSENEVDNVQEIPVSDAYSSYFEDAEGISFLPSSADRSQDMMLLDNGFYWTSPPGANTWSWVGWIPGMEFHSVDVAEDGNYSVVRNALFACETEQGRNWDTDLINYQGRSTFSGRTKEVGNFTAVHLWGEGNNPESHLFSDQSGSLVVKRHSRNDGQPFDDGNVPIAVPTSAPMQEEVSSQHVTVDDEGLYAYVLYQGPEESCGSNVFVYSLASDRYVASIPLRWRANAIAVVGGSQATASDDKLGVVYEFGYNRYGRSQPLATYIDLDGSVFEETDSQDYDGYDVLYRDLSLVRASRHALLFQLEMSTEASVITAYHRNGGTSFYEELGSFADDDDFDPSNPEEIDFKAIDLWGLGKPGPAKYMAVLSRGSNDLLKILNVTDTDTVFSFGTVFDDVELPSKLNPALPFEVEPDGKKILVGAETNNDPSQAMLFSFPESFSFGEPEDYLATPSRVSAWSAEDQGPAGTSALYSADVAKIDPGTGDVTTRPKLQRWQLKLGADNHFEFDNAFSAELAGDPVFLQVLDPSEDSFILGYRQDDSITFRLFSKDLGVAETPDGDGGNSGGGGSGGNGFGSSGGGALLYLPLLLILIRRRW